MSARLKLVVAVAAALAAAAAATAQKSDAADSRIACGSERWTVKTLQDRPALRPAHTTTVHALVSLPAPGRLPDTRLAFERNVYTVTAKVTKVIHADDGDLHLVLSSGRDHMIAKAPDADCDTNATLHYRKAIALARDLVRVCARARITGVVFFDFKHGQTGVAPNAIELHPILGFHCLSA